MMYAIVCIGLLYSVTNKSIYFNYKYYIWKYWLKLWVGQSMKYIKKMTMQKNKIKMRYKLSS